MSINNFAFHRREEIFTFLLVFALIFGLLCLVLWTSLPFNCSPEECSKSPEKLNHYRLELLITFSPLASLVIAPAIIFIRKSLRKRIDFFSKLGLVSLAWPAISCLLLIPLEIIGLTVAVLGVGFSITDIIIHITKKNRVKDFPIHWHIFLPLLFNMVWCFLSYFYLIRFWEIFAD